MCIKTFTSIKYSALCLFLVLAACAGPSGETSDYEADKITQKVVPQNERKELKQKGFSDSDEALVFLQAYGNKTHPDRYRIETRFGSIDIQLFNNTPLHKANFNYLAEQGYFNDTWFYRVSEGHVIQAGNTDGFKTIEKRKAIGSYVIPSELNTGNLHTYGAVAAARSYKQNPDKDSDPFEFYIVLGKTYTQNQLKAMADEYGFDLNKEKIEVYSSQGGAPHLDGEHTVFGRVISGISVVEEIARQKTDEGEWPLLNIPIQLKPLP